MSMIEINVKPLSVNECWQGKRFKTKSYEKYETCVLFLLPPMKLPPPPLKISYEFGFSNVLSDFDNPVKPFTDILQKKYGINDKDIFEAVIVKKIVKKGAEYIRFKIDGL